MTELEGTVFKALSDAHDALCLVGFNIERIEDKLSKDALDAVSDAVIGFKERMIAER